MTEWKNEKFELGVLNMRTENRKRNMQVKFRLTPEENDLLRDKIHSSGMTINDYIIQSLIRKTPFSILSWEKIFCGNGMEMKCLLGKRVVGYAHCSYFDELKETRIHSLFVERAYRNTEMMDELIESVISFAREQGAERVKVVCGCEPFSRTGQMALDTEMDWYAKRGFERSNSRFPYMIKILQPKGDVMNDYQKLD